jgi:hypothetical protein
VEAESEGSVLLPQCFPQRRAVLGRRVAGSLLVLVCALYGRGVEAATTTTTAAPTTTPTPVECPAVSGGSPNGLYRLTLSLAAGAAEIATSGFSGWMGEPHSCVELLVPAGAWPEDTQTAPTITVVELAPEAIAALPAGASVQVPLHVLSLSLPLSDS